MTATTTFCSKEKRTLFSRFFELVTRRAKALVPSGYDRDVYLFIADRSLPFGKLSHAILDRWFLDGVTGKGNPRGHRAGLSMGKSQLYKSRKALKDQGLIRDQKVGRCKRYAIVLEPVWPLLSQAERELFAPLLALVDPDWQAEEQGEQVHDVDVQQVHSVDPLTKKKGSSEEKRSARKLAPEAGPGASPFSSRGEGAHAPVEPPHAAAPAVAVPAAPPSAASPAPIQVVPVASPTVKVAKRGRPARELWGSTLADQFDAAFREAWPDAPLPAEASIKLRAQWEFIATHWRRTDIGPGDWIEWCVKNWRTIYLTVFQHVEHRQESEAAWRAEAPSIRRRQWREDMVYPEYPDFDFLRKYRKAFESEWDRRDSQMTRTDLLPGAKWLRELLRKGWPLEDAQRQVEARLAERKFVEDLKARERKHNDRVRAFESKMQLPENRLMLARIRSGRDPEAAPVKPVALAKPRLKPDFSRFNDDAPLPPIPVWRDDPEEGPELPAGHGIGQLPSRHPV